MSVVIKYGDIAVGAKDKFVPSSQNEIFFSKIEQIQKNVSFPNYQNACDYLSVPLDGSAIPIPDDYVTSNIGYWSELKSDENGVFQTPIILSFKADEYFTSPGISFTFDTNNEIYATELEIVWKRDGQELERQTFYPTSSSFFCSKKVDFYDEVVATFYSINMPFCPLKIKSIEYGFGTEFKGVELREVKITQAMSPISSELPINSGDIRIHSKRGIEFSFQERQPLDIYSDGQLLLKTFVDKYRRISKNEWSINGEDYIGLMDSIPFYGGIYNEKNAADLIREIFDVAKVPYELSEDFLSEVVTGYIPYTTCREALMQVLFAISAVANTTESEKVNISTLSKEIRQEIPPERIFQGQTSGVKSRVTRVEIISHSYRPIQDTVEAYNAEKNPIGEDVFVVFSEPLHSLSIINGTIKESGANYAILSATIGCVLTGKKYDHTMVTNAVKNPLVLATDPENVVAIEKATLVSSSNIDKVLDLCYTYIVNKSDLQLKIVDGKHVQEGEDVLYGEFVYGDFLYGAQTPTVVTYDLPNRLGDLIVVPLEMGCKKTARITKQSFSLIGNVKVKDTVLE